MTERTQRISLPLHAKRAPAAMRRTSLHRSTVLFAKRKCCWYKKGAPVRPNTPRDHIGIIVKLPQRVSCLVTSLLSLVWGAAGADPADTGSGNLAAGKRADALEEIVVTAEKRSSTVQDTPISMTALSGDLLQQEGITGIGGIIQAVPGISQRTAGAGQTELEMRGLSSSGGASPTVGFYLDDYPLTPPAAALNVKW